MISSGSGRQHLPVDISKSISDINEPSHFGTTKNDYESGYAPMKSLRVHPNKDLVNDSEIYHKKKTLDQVTCHTSRYQNRFKRQQQQQVSSLNQNSNSNNNRDKETNHPASSTTNR